MYSMFHATQLQHLDNRKPFHFKGKVRYIHENCANPFNIR